MSNAIDHRIFGFTELGQLRANLYNGAGLPYAGALYSWVWASTSRQLAHKLDEQWEQPINEAEFDVIEQLEAEAESETIDCEDCGGTGRDPGNLSAYEPEECRSCDGSGCETVPALVGFGGPARAPRIASIGNGLYVRIRKAVA